MLSRQMISRRQFLAGSSLALTGVFVAACTPAVQQTSPSGSESAASSSEQITLTAHVVLNEHLDWLESRVPLFEEQHSGATIIFEAIPGNEMLTKLYAMAASNTIGDVCWSFNWSMLEYAKRGVTLPLDDIIAAKEFDTSVFWPAAMEGVTAEGEIHGLPKHGNYGVCAFYYNKTMHLDAMGSEADIDWTVDDLHTFATAVTDAPDTWGFYTSGTSDISIIQATRTFGGDLLDAEGQQCLLLEEASVRGLQWLYDLQYTMQVAPPLNSPGQDMRNLFVAGKLGCTNSTPGYASEFVNIDFDFEWDSLAAPIGPEGHRGTALAMSILCVTRNSQHPNEAFDALDFYSTREDGILHTLAGAGSPGCRDDVWESEELNNFQPLYGRLRAAYPDGPGPRYFPANGRTAQFNDVLANNIARIWAGQVGFDEGIEETTRLCQEVLDQESIG